MSTASDYNGDLSASRKLTDEETAQLRDIIVKGLAYAPEEQEDVDDLLDYTFAMTSNGKSLSYIVSELLSMEMDVCQETQAHSIAKQIAKFLEETINQVQEEEEEEPNDEKEESHVVSLKSSGGVNNALTMSGALGSSRERKSKDDSKRNVNKPLGGDNRGRGDNKRGGGRQSDNRRSSSGGRGGRGRLTQSEAFERLSGGNNTSRNDNRQGGGRRGDDRRNDQGRTAGRGGRGGGELRRGGCRNDIMGRGGGRGSPGQRGGARGSPNQRGGAAGRNAPMSGNRRTHDEMRSEEDFIPAGRGVGRGDGRFQARGSTRGGRFDGNRGGGRKSEYEEGNKRQRGDDYGWEEQGGGYAEWGGGYDEGYNDYNWRGAGRGPRGRGRGRFGRGFGPKGGEQQVSVEATGEIGGDVAEAAIGHPSPLVAASFGGRVYRGRGRGRGRGGRGGYRAQVANMIASKAWVRPKKEGEGGDAGGGDSKQNGNSATGAVEG